jgi:adenylate kinase family enzyme
MKNKIHIIGSVGSGKTTLGKQLSSKLNIPLYELDNVVWKRSKSGDVRRNDEERDLYLNSIIQSDAWIIEGVHHKWVTKSFQKSDLIIFLDTPYSKRKFRIILRFILQKLRIEKANYQPTFKIFKDMFKWNAYFESKSKPEIFTILNDYKAKVIMVKDGNEVKEYFGIE